MAWFGEEKLLDVAALLFGERGLLLFDLVVKLKLMPRLFMIAGAVVENA